MAEKSKKKELNLPVYLFHEGTNYEAYKLFCRAKARSGLSGSGHLMPRA